jgi:hypothetical protein
VFKVGDKVKLSLAGKRSLCAFSRACVKNYNVYHTYLIEHADDVAEIQSEPMRGLYIIRWMKPCSNNGWLFTRSELKTVAL